MSFDPDEELFGFEPAPPAKTPDDWRKNPKWLDIIGISREECINGTGRMERFDPKELQRKNFGNGFIPKGKNPLNNKIGFGKHKDLTFEELKTQHPQYFFWACENIKGFREKATKFVKVD